MKNLNFKKSFCLLLFVVFFSNNFAGSLQQRKNHDFKEISKAQQTFYKKHPWSFIEQEFINLPRKNYYKFSTPKKLLAGSIPIALLSILDLFGGLENMSSNEKFNIWVCTIFLGMSITAFLNFTSIDEQLLMVLDNLFKNYDPDLNKDLKVNYKNFIPTEFHETFDAFYLMYVQDGIDSLKDSLDILYEIRDQVFYKIKKEKYKPKKENNTSVVVMPTIAPSVSYTKPINSTVGYTKSNYSTTFKI